MQEYINYLNITSYLFPKFSDIFRGTFICLLIILIVYFLLILTSRYAFFEVLLNWAVQYSRNSIHLAMSGIRAFPPLAIIPELILYSHSRDILYTFFGSLLATNNFKSAFAVTLLFIFWYIAGMICYNKNKGILRRGIFGFNKLWDSEDNFYRRLVFVSSPLAASVASMASWIIGKDVFTSFDLLSNGLFAFILISSSISSFLVLLYFLCSRLFFYFRYVPVTISGLIAIIILCTLFWFDLVFMSIIEGFIFYKRGKTPTKGMATFTQVWLLNQVASKDNKFWNYSYNISIFLSEFFSFNLSIFFAWIISVTFYYLLTYSLFNYQGTQF